MYLKSSVGDVGCSKCLVKHNVDKTEAEKVIYYYNKKKEPKSHDIIPSGKQNFAVPKHYWW